MSESHQTGRAQTVVGKMNTAQAMGSGDLEVFATPAMVALMEQAAASCLSPRLSEGETSVGTKISVSHTAASPVGATVTATAKLESFDGKRATFTLTAEDGFTPIGSGTHTRAVVAADRFLQNLHDKKQT